MKQLGLLVLAIAACSKEPAKTESTPAVIKGPTARAEDPTNLPAAGTAPPAAAVTKEQASMWDSPINTLQGKRTKLAEHKGKALLLVNVASQCGLTPQYTTLEALQKKYAAKGFTVIGFPCNQFGEQEPGTAEEIQTFCSTKYGVTFPMTEKIDVNGNARHDIYKALTTVADAGGHSGDIRWNFEKFVISADGTKITRFDPRTKPDDPKLIAALEAALPK